MRGWIEVHSTIAEAGALATAFNWASGQVQAYASTLVNTVLTAPVLHRVLSAYVVESTL